MSPGCSDLTIDYAKQKCKLGGQTIKKGDFISLDGTKGEVILGECKTSSPTLSGAFGILMYWADEFRKIGVRTNADTPKDAKVSAGIRRGRHRAVPDRAHVLRGGQDSGRA